MIVMIEQDELGSIICEHVREKFGIKNKMQWQLYGTKREDGKFEDIRVSVEVPNKVVKK
jgi:hypothetical protein